MTAKQNADNGSSQESAAARSGEAAMIRPAIYWTVMALVLLFPTLLTLVYFVLLAHFPSSLQQAVYGVGKCANRNRPAFWFIWVLRGKLRRDWVGSKGIGVGIGFGAGVLLAMLMLYFYWLKPSGHLQGLEVQVIQKVRDLGLDSVGKYAATGLFYALAHSFLEEYYWRWFVFGQLQTRMGVSAGILLSSLGFMAHHIILLATFLGWDSPLAYLFAGGVAIGGAVWAWIYAWSRSLLGPWLSHMLIDAAIFLIGFDLVRNVIG